MNEEEKKKNKGQFILGQVQVVIAIGAAAGITSLQMDQFEKIITGEYTNWKEVGGVDAPFITVGREASEAVFSVLKDKYPFFRSAKFNQGFEKDDDVVAFVQNVHGKHAVAFGAAPNFMDKEGLSVLTIPGFSIGLKMGLDYDLSHQNNPLVKSVDEYAASQEWAAIAEANGFLPPTE